MYTNNSDQASQKVTLMDEQNIFVGNRNEYRIPPKLVKLLSRLNLNKNDS